MTMRYHYCPECGTKLVGRTAGDEGDVPYCDPCGKYWFDTFADVTIVMVTNEHHEIAMLQQQYLSDRYWNYIAGFIKPGENAEETARREVREEVGLELERLEYAGTHWFGEREQLMHAFIGFAKKADFTLSSEVNQAEWVPVEEAPGRMFPERPGNTQQPLYRKYLEMLNNGQ